MRLARRSIKPALHADPRGTLLWLLAWLLTSFPSHAPALAQMPQTANDPAALEFFEKEIRPLFAERCWSCHGPEKAQNNLRLDSRAAILAGGDSGPAVVPNDPAESLLIQVVQYDDLLKMPPKGKLPDSDLRKLERWVELGAPWPPEHAPEASTAGGQANSGDFNLRERARHWSFLPVALPTVPPVRDANWPRNPVDCFILARLEAHGVSPAPEADRATLLRRLTYDLIGLPPTPEEIDSFLADTRPNAYERQVERLLASPHFGERWGRHWLDLVRFVETSGHEFDYDIPFAWRYRDYVIRALNADVPYDRFVTEHIAGDLLASPTEPDARENEAAVAPAFHWFGDGTHSPVDLREEQLRRFDQQIDVLGKAFLGLTIACARCHDHKFDPVTQRDYYALAGFLKSTRYATRDLNPPPPSLVAALRENTRELARQANLACAAPQNPAPHLFESFDRDKHAPWHASDAAFGTGPSTPGDAHLARDDAIRSVPPGVAHSALADESLQGVLRSPTFTIDHNFIHYLAAGRKGRVQLVVDGFEKIRDPIYGGLAREIDHGADFRWITQDVSMWRGHRAYIELIDGGMPDFTTGTVRILPADGFIAVDEIRFSNNPAPPTTPGPSPQTDKLQAMLHNHALHDLLAARNELLAQIKPPALALTIIDGTGEDELFLPRGLARNAAAPVPRRFLELFAENAETVEPLGSGRLHLARHITAPDNPLFARVAVNRLWQHHMGRGIVPTPDDFGRMGLPPSHPELLDWLAREFASHNYSFKYIHRIIVCSSAYRMSSRPRPDAEHADPANRLWHRAELRRLEGEAVRDALLATSGTLARTMYGQSVPPHLTPHMEGRGRPAASGPLDGAGRRSIYLNIRRNFPPPLLQAFDLPSPAGPIGRRNLSNVPAQALALMNDPFVVEQATRWAERECSEPTLPHHARVRRMYLRALGRPPTHAETQLALRIVREQSAQDESVKWSRLAHVLFNLKEFTFIP